jgi:hypothetical protein
VTYVAPPRNFVPTFYLGAAFGYSPDSDPATWVFTDLSSRVRKVVTLSVAGGPNASSPSPSQMGLMLSNTDGALTAKNPLSPYWPDVVRGVPLKFGITWPGATDPPYELLTCLATGWPLQLNAGVADVTVPIAAAGRLRRMQNTSKVVASAMSHTIAATAPTFWWPLEDATGATQGASKVAGGAPLLPDSTGGVTFGSVAGPGGAGTLPDFSAGGTLAAQVATTATAYRVEFVIKCPPVTSPGFAIGMVVQPTGNGGAPIDVWEFGVKAPADGGAFLEWTADGGGTTDIRTTGVTLDDDAWHHVRIDFSTSAGSYKAIVAIDDVSVLTWTTARDYTPPRRVGVGGSGGTSNISSFGQLAIWAPWAGSVDTFTAFSGYAGELATVRVARVCAENGIPVTVIASADPSQPMGAQAIDTVYNLLNACAVVDNGTLHDAGPLGRLVYSPGAYRYNQAAQMTVTYGLSQISDGLGGTYDDQGLVNGWTFTRTGGSSASFDDTASQAVEGVLTAPETVNAASDAQLTDLASFRTHLTSFDAFRVPSIGIDLRRSPELVQSLLALTLPARLDPAGLVSPYPPDQQRQFIEGWSAVLDKDRWQVDFVCRPYDPWVVGVYDTSKYDSGSSSLTADMAAGHVGDSIAFSVTTTDPGDLWTLDSNEWTVGVRGPLYLYIDGEVMQITNITGATSPQTITATRGVNGVAIAHTATAARGAVNVYRPAVVAL